LRGIQGSQKAWTTEAHRGEQLRNNSIDKRRSFVGAEILVSRRHLRASVASVVRAIHGIQNHSRDAPKRTSESAAPFVVAFRDMLVQTIVTAGGV
jgi:hypothetical protein